MIKRPFLFILLFYLIGMYFAWMKIPLLAFLLLEGIVLLVIYLLLHRNISHRVIKEDKFIWSLPFLIVLGFLAMKGQLKEPELEHEFDQKQNCEVTGEISMIVQKENGKALYLRKVIVDFLDGRSYLCEKIIVHCTSQNWGSGKPNPSLLKEYLVGNQITVEGSLQKFSLPSNPGQFNEKRYYQIENIDYKMQANKITLVDGRYSGFHAALETIKRKLIEVYHGMLKEKESGTLIAMILGEKYLLDDEIKELYQLNGISHILAISGLHISLIGMFIFHLLKKLKVPIVPTTIFSIFFIYSYGVLTDFSVSTNRAVVMMTVMFVASLFGKTYDMLSSLCLSAFLILLQNPLQILSAGFLLSFAAVVGIATIYPILLNRLPSKNPVVTSLYLSISAQITTTPIVIYFFYQFPVYGLITNIIILPFVTILTLTSILAGIAGIIFLPLGIFLIGGSNYILQFYEWICNLVGELPYHLITVGKPDLLRIFLYFVIIVAFLWMAKRYEKRSIILLPVLALLFLLMPSNKGGLSVSMLDVGQGDGMVMQSDRGTTYLIDGGSSDVKKIGKYRLLPFLLSQGIDRIDYAIVSHSDNDHISGLKELMTEKKVSIDTLILPNLSKKDEAYQELERMAKEYGIKIQYIQQGDYIIDGKLKIHCLHPKADYNPTSINAYSTVLAVNYDAFQMLLTGDLEKDGEVAVTKLLSEALEEKKEGIDFNGLKWVPSDFDVLNKRVTKLIQFRFQCSALEKA